jgi:hypothetical protein
MAQLQAQLDLSRGDPTFAGWCRRGHVFTWPLNREEDEVVILKEYIIARTRRARPEVTVATLAFVAVTLGAAVSGCGAAGSTPGGTEPPATVGAPATGETTSPALVAEGQRVFRFDTFGDEQVWTDKLRLNEVVEKSVDPTTALKVGLKVDADALPPGILGKVALKSPRLNRLLHRRSTETS